MRSWVKASMALKACGGNYGSSAWVRAATSAERGCCLVRIDDHVAHERREFTDESHGSSRMEGSSDSRRCIGRGRRSASVRLDGGDAAAAYWQTRLTAVGPRHEALQLYFLPPSPAQALASKPAAPPAQPVMPTIKYRRSTRVVRSTLTPRPTTPALNLTLPPQTPGYVAGGAEFQRQLERANHALPVARLPGSSVPLVAGLPFADPKTQGIAGVVRTLQHLFGVPNSHCIDVDVWQNMTRRERLKRHISMDEVKRVEAENGCLQARVPRRSAGTDP